ncbi:FecR family protein [Cyclobacterium salsum]|uniref:FecR family protein n=1 Tax=Cyclobacterium salsum TaxID=2666329 RepID=UPI00139140FB|nr:FecR domain-containing protein [Cyclobacterium salsum]
MKKEKLIKFLNNLTTAKDNREVMDWLKKTGSEDRFLNLIEKDWNFGRPAKVSQSKQQQMLDHIHKATLKNQEVHNGKAIFQQFLKLGKVAATFLLLLFSVYFLYELGFSKKGEPILAEVAPMKIQKSTAAGEKLRLLLPDKSEVVVNSLSTLTFYSDFGIDNREIILEGEAFFSVAPDKEKPFIVKTGAVATTALGTAFNAYSRAEGVKISLTEGRVNVTKNAQVISLLPGEMALEQSEMASGLSKAKFDLDQTTLWKEGKIRFQSKPFKEILQTLENWYGVRFETKALDNRKVTGLFNNESLEDILTGLSFSLGFEYQINQKNVVIKF